MDVLSTAGLAAEHKDLKIALLRQQLPVPERRVQAQIRYTRPEKVMLVVPVPAHLRTSQKNCCSADLYTMELDVQLRRFASRLSLAGRVTDH